MIFVATLLSLFLQKTQLTVQNPIEAPKVPEPKVEVVRSYIGEITAYTSREEETDDTPTIGAMGTEVHWGVVATNAYPFGTKMRFPEIYGDEIFVVKDRMNSRYKHRIDIWFPEHPKALKFGIQNARVEIIKDPVSDDLAVK